MKVAKKTLQDTCQREKVKRKHEKCQHRRENKINATESKEK